MINYGLTTHCFISSPNDISYYTTKRLLFLCCLYFSSHIMHSEFLGMTTSYAYTILIYLFLTLSSYYFLVSGIFHLFLLFQIASV
jgi:hypothetical protein